MKDFCAIMEKQNDSRCASKHFTPKNPSLSFADTSGSSPVNLSNAGRDVISLGKRHQNSHQMADKSVQTDPMFEAFSPLLLEELQMKTNFLTDNLETILKSLEPGFKQNILGTRSYENISNEITSAGDVDSNAIKCPAFWSQPKPNCGNRTLSEAEGTGINKQQNKSDLLKEKLNQILECALKIKKAIPANLQHPSGGTAADILHLPTGVIMTPVTQTEPVDTYVKFLQVIDEAAGFRPEPMDNRNRFIRNLTSPRRTRMRISNRPHTVDTTGHQSKPTVRRGTAKTDRRSSNRSLDIDLNETLNRRKPVDLDVTAAEVMSDHTAKEWPDDLLVKPRGGSLNKKPVKITKLVSADAITCARPDEKNFCLTDYISALRQVHIRSPATKRIREFSIRSKTYFDFDDYYEKLINMHDKYELM